MSDFERVVVTGVATVNPLGLDARNFWENSLKGESGVSKVDQFFIPDEMSQIAGQVANFKNSGPLDRSLQFALKAANDLFIDSCLDLHSPHSNKEKWGVFISTAIAQIALMEESFTKLTESGSKKLKLSEEGEEKSGCNPFFFNSTASYLAKHFGFLGGSSTLATGCTGGVDAIGFAVNKIRRGKVEVALTGATEAPITPLVVASFNKIGATSKRNDRPKEASRPFDKDRDGFVLAEGCGLLLLESLTHAKKRGAKIYAEIKGYGSVNNCFHMTDIPEDGQSIARACFEAFKDAGLDPQEVDFISSHGSSTPQNDVAESNAYRLVFGKKSNRIPVNSIKSQTGHALSAANCVEVVSAILSLQHQIIPPTINLKNQDPRIDLDIVGNVPRRTQIDNILKSSSGFSGIHSSLIIGRHS